jgi:phosphopantetheine--protein transferase-like protein
MILGIGTDILNIQRISNAFEGDSKSFIRHCFTIKEQTEASDRPNPILYYATRFAGKEAILKCFGIDGNEIRLNEIEILGLETGQPSVTLLGRLKEIVMSKGVKDVCLSLSYETEYALAFALAQD